jgi:hypothetical protein
MTKLKKAHRTQYQRTFTLLTFGPKIRLHPLMLFDDLPQSQGLSLVVVDAGIATKEQFTRATLERALLGRLRQQL